MPGEAKHNTGEIILDGYIVDTFYLIPPPVYAWKHRLD